MTSRFSHIALIANPTAQSGRGEASMHKALTCLSKQAGENHVELMATQHAGHAEEIARTLDESVDLVVAAGGDGLVHEVVNGLMALREERGPEAVPAFAVIPCGSGNDYAMTLGMSTKIEQAVGQIMSCPIVRADVGCVNGHYFAETLSFGVDAAIGLGTVELRKKTGHSGALLYAESGIDQILHHRDEHTFRLIADGVEHTGSALTFAVQIGRSYGGGFLICPEARIDDGLFDLCIALGPLSLPKALFAFAKAKSGKHTNLDFMKMLTCHELQVDFESFPPTQMDGEKLEGNSFRISLVPGALPVVCAS